MVESFIAASQVLRRLEGWSPASGTDQVLPLVTAELWDWYKEDLNCQCWEGLSTQGFRSPKCSQPINSHDEKDVESLLFRCSGLCQAIKMQHCTWL